MLDALTTAYVTTYAVPPGTEPGEDLPIGLPPDEEPPIGEDPEGCRRCGNAHRTGVLCRACQDAEGSLAF